MVPMARMLLSELGIRWLSQPRFGKVFSLAIWEDPINKARRPDEETMAAAKARTRSNFSIARKVTKSTWDVCDLARIGDLSRARALSRVGDCSSMVSEFLGTGRVSARSAYTFTWVNVRARETSRRKVAFF